ncbi:hypothetical protein ACHAW6_001370 [Cyclotella cf. meneghiniana]
MNYYDTYAPVITWFAIRLMIILAMVNKQALRQIDFVMAYTQAPIVTDLYMETPSGIETTMGKTPEIYGQKQTRRVWNQFLVQKLESIGFKQSKINECMLYREDIIFIVYVDDGIFLGKSDDQLTGIIKELTDIGLEVKDHGNQTDYMGINIKCLPDGSYTFSQKALINTIINDVGLTPSDHTKPIPAKCRQRLHGFLDSPPFKQDWNYSSVVDKLNYLAQTSQPDILYATYMVAKYASNPRKEHDMGLHFKPNSSKGFYCYADADFAGEWNRDFAQNNLRTTTSRSGWFIIYANCLVILCSKLQSQMVLSTTEAEYIALSQALCDVIPVMSLLGKMREHKFNIILLERLLKLRPQRKYINVCYHHFREHVRKDLIKIYPIDTQDQIADMLTKPLPLETNN